jgi:REP element-mobilizing transposase RayT
MDCVWLLTNTCYGNWLPGDARGFVGQVWEHRPDDPKEKPRVRHNLPGTVYDQNIAGLQAKSALLLKSAPIQLTRQQAEVLLRQLQETAHFRRWTLLAVAIMHNHFHIVVAAPGNVSPSKVLGDFKSWGTRRLSSVFGAPPSQTWWTERGSKRKLADDGAVDRATYYVLFRQPNPLVTWSPDTDVN